MSVSRMALALSANAFSVSAPSVWDSISFDCRSAQLVSSFRRSMLKTIELFDIAYTDYTVVSAIMRLRFICDVAL